MTEPPLTAPPPDRGRRPGFPLLWIILIVGFLGVLFYARQAAQEVRVLFIGNSYTFSNDLPSMVSRLSESGGVAMSASVLAPGGAWLADHARSADVRDAIADGDYDVVVLQEQSMAPADPQIARNSTYPAAGALVERAATVGARVIFFETWAHRGGNRQVGHGSFDSMQAAISATYSDLATRFAGEVAPAGQAWRAHFMSGSTIPLHADDGSHPTVAGSYLAAAVIAATISEAEPGQFTWYDPMGDMTARMLLESAGAALSGGR